MKRVLLATLLLASLVFGQIEISGNITADETWTASNDYLLTGQTFVKDGVTLTIEPGTFIKSESDDGTGLAPTLVIERGAKIIANGTADAPITFTSNLSPSELPQRGTWGGLILLGNAPTNAGESFVEGLVGVPYGGNDPDDDSGILRYVRVWYGGRSIGQDNEINGITFAGVGRGTTVENCEVAYNLDDGFEFFGGTVEVKYLSALFCGDDAFDTDEGFQGKGQFLFAILGQDQCGRGFEMDNDGSDMDNQPRSYPQFHNVTLIGPGGGAPANDGADEMIRLREGTGGDFRNVVIAYGNGFGLRVKDDATQALIGDSLLFSSNNVIYDCATAQFHSDVVGDFTAQDVNPQFRSLEGWESGTGLIDPRPAAGNALLTGGESLPDDGFFTQVDFLGAFGSDLWLQEYSLLDETGRLPDTMTDIKINKAPLATDFYLNAYPNPFNPTTTVQFTLPENQDIKLTLCNLHGQVVQVLLDNHLSAGSYTAPLNGSRLTSGIYFITLQTTYHRTTHKITLIK